MAYEEIITSSKTAASGGTDLSLVTTGEKYLWNNKLATELAMYDKIVSYGFSKSISIKFKKGGSIPAEVTDVRIPVKIVFTNQYANSSTTLTVVMTPANCSPVGRILQVGELEYEITVKSATNTSEHSTIYTFDLTNTDNWGTCDISVPGTFFQFFDISAVDTTGSNPSTLTIIRPGSEGIKLSNSGSFITAKKSGDYTWLSESKIDGSNFSGAKGIAVALAAECPKLVTSGSSLSGFSFKIDQNDALYEVNCFELASSRYWKAFLFRDSNGGISANAVAYSSDFDYATGFTFNASSNPTINVSWRNTWIGFSVIKFK